MRRLRTNGDVPQRVRVSYSTPACLALLYARQKHSGLRRLAVRISLYRAADAGRYRASATSSEEGRLANAPKQGYLVLTGTFARHARVQQRLRSCTRTGTTLAAGTCAWCRSCARAEGAGRVARTIALT